MKSIFDIWNNFINATKEFMAGLVKNKVITKEVLNLDNDGEIHGHHYLILVDASKNHVKVTLPSARTYSGQLSIICVDASFGIEILANSEDEIFDSSNIDFHAKGDSLTFVNDQRNTWYVIGRYAAQWYA